MILKDDYCSFFPGITLFRCGDVHTDHRGHLVETFREDDFASVGIEDHFTVDVLSASTKGVVRGLHYQVGKHAQSKLIRCSRGTILDLFLDLRVGSPSFGRCGSVLLDEYSNAALYVPVGFAHGFVAIEDFNEVNYKLSTYQHAESERSVNCKPFVALTKPAIVSARDAMAPSFDEYVTNPAFSFVAGKTRLES